MNNFKDIIKDLQETESLSDVTLVCNDDTEIKAHKFVLIGSSPVFRSMLLQSSQRDTIVYLRGVKRREVEWALQFMYLGQIQVPQTHLQTFIELAKDLKMKGIYTEEDVQDDENKGVETMTTEVIRNYNVDNMEKSIDEHKEKEVIEREEQKPQAEKFPSLDDNVSTETQNLVRYTCNFLTPEVISNFNVADMERSIDEQKEKEVIEREEQKAHVEKFPTLDNNVITETQNLVRYTCKFCSFDATGLKYAKTTLNAHIERVHEGVRYPCDLCAYQANKQQNLKDHKASVHKIDPFYRCLLCNFCTNHSKTWMKHAERRHPACQPQEIFEVTKNRPGRPRKELSEVETLM